MSKLFLIEFINNIYLWLINISWIIYKEKLCLIIKSYKLFGGFEIIKKPPNTILLDAAASFLTWPSYKVIVLMA